MRLRNLLSNLFLLLCSTTLCVAAPLQVEVVSTCGTQNFVLGPDEPLLMDKTGLLCTNAQFTGTISIGTVTQGPKGGDGTADAWYVQPGVGATFPTTPVGVTTTMSGGAVVAQNVFQSVAAASASRKGAAIQNTSAISTNTLYVFFGPNGSATKAASLQVGAGLMISATTQTGSVLTDNISVTCADVTPSNCTFVAATQ